MWKWIIVSLIVGACVACQQNGDERSNNATLASSRSESHESPDAQLLAMNIVGKDVKRTIEVTTPAFSDNGRIPEKYSDYGEKISPELKWGELPSEAKSVVVLMEDPDAPKPKPFVHWILYNLPGDTRELRMAVPPAPRLPALAGALQGRNSKGATGYFGPRPPVGDPAHRYYFQVFALDKMLELKPGAARDEVLKDMDGHVMAQGSIMGTFRREGE